MSRTVTQKSAQTRLDFWVGELGKHRPIRALLPKLAKKSDPLRCEVKLVSGVEMQKLNRQYRGLNKQTDILSFPAPHVFVQHGFLGELIVAIPVLRAQAEALGHDDLAELDILLVHGLLHLLGLDHELSQSEKVKMKRLETLLLDKTGSRGLISRKQVG